MKRQGGGGRGGAKARGVLRADKEGANATKPAGGNGTKPAGGNGTKPAGGNGTKPAGGNGTKPVGGNGSQPLLLNGTLLGGNNTNETRPELGGTYGGEDKKDIGPKEMDALLPQPDLSKTCQFLYRTENTSGTAIIVFKKSGNLLCMGSIVDHNHILTAKRCVNKADAHNLVVILGCAKPWWGQKSQVKKVRKILNHEYEAAMLRLKSRIVYTKFVQPARLPSSATKKTKLTWLYTGPYYVMGFPVDKHAVPGEKAAKTLYYGYHPDWYFELEFCEKIHTSFVLDPDKVFCTTGDVPFCWGSWGAPVLVNMGTYWLQIGVVTLDACTSIKSGPYVAFRTDAYADWIKGHLKELHHPT